MKFSKNRKEERTDYTIYKMFGKSEYDFSEEVMIWLPFEVVMAAVRKFCYENYTVSIDATDTSIWNLFAGTNFIESLFDDEDFVEAVTKEYDNSIYCELDYYDWEDMKPWED